MDREALTAFYHQLDRSFFLDDAYKAHSDRDRPLPIGFGQTISQPSLVLEMTWLLSPEKESRVLEIGTGSGYQTALLAEFAGQVYTMERIEELARKARVRLDQLGYANIHYRTGDGSQGWPEEAPFDRIILTAAAGKRPLELIGQLAPGGRMVAPVGPPSGQELLLITRDKAGQVQEERRGYVSFVEMVGPYGWEI